MKRSENSVIRNKKQSQPKSSDGHSVTRTIRTYLVDDSPFMLVLLARMLAKDERILIVGSVTDSQKAFQSALMARPDLVLMDLHMPGMDGVEVTRWLKQLQNPPAVFMVTSDESPHAQTRCLRAGADAFLVKSPNLAVQLERAIQKFFSGNYRVRKVSAIKT